MGQFVSNRRAWNACVSLWVLGAASCAFAAPALAQQTADDEETVSDAANASKTGKDDIIVTGTLIRGVAPTGTNVVGVNREQITATGAATGNEIISQIPQAGNFFNTLPQIVAGTGAGQQVLRPNLRSLPSGGTSTGAATLILVDGHRTVNIGIDQSAPDPQTVPAALLERVEVVTNGGSALYGSDAIGGVINYITRRRFDGIEATARYGIGDDYRSFDASVTVGKAWSTGSIYAAYSHSENNSFFGRDRDYYQSINFNTGLPLTTTCAAPNITTTPGTSRYVVSGNTLAPVTAAVPCDLTDYFAIIPEQRQDSVFAGLSQELSPSIKFDVRAYYTRNQTSAIQTPEAATLTIRSPITNRTNGNPFYRQAPGGTANADQTIALNLGSAYDKEITNRFHHYGITPQFTIDFAPNWQARLMFNYGRSNTSYLTQEVDSAALALAANGNTTARAANTFLNPYDITSTSAAVFDSVRNSHRAGEAVSELFNSRAIVDGTAFALPGGDVKLAVGVEYLVDKFARRTGTIATGASITTPFARYSRNIFSVFGELQIPVFGADNETTLFHSLVIAASGRYDRYSDFGGTFNPKLGLTWKPVDWITFRGSWGKSFNAPTAVDLVVGSTFADLNANSFNSQFRLGGYVANPAIPATAGVSYALTLQGALVGLQPQKATDWSIGADIELPFVPGLRLGASYYNIDFVGALGKPPLTGTNPNVPSLLNNYPGVLVYNPTPAQLADALAQVTNPGLLAAFQALNPAAQLYVIQDFRTRNLSNSKIAGIDFSASYSRPTGFGSIDARVAGNVRVTNESQLSATLPFTDGLLDGGSLWNITASVGASVGDFRAQATLNHSAGYDVAPTSVNSPANPGGTTLQARVGSFNVVNFFFSYDLKRKFMAESLQFTLNVNNAFNATPPIFRTTNGGTGTANGQTLGRVFQLGVRAKF